MVIDGETAMAIPRRLFLSASGQAVLWSLVGNHVLADNYPTGWGPEGSMPMQTSYEDYLIGNFSGGFEKMYPTSIVRASGAGKPLRTAKTKLKSSTIAEIKKFQVAKKKPAFLVAKNEALVFENYEFERTSTMRFHGKSLTKSVLSLLCGAAFDNGILGSLDDPIQKYEPRLSNNPLGKIKIRHALNMSSGADICAGKPFFCGERNDGVRLTFSGFEGKGPKRPLQVFKITDMEKAVLNWSYGTRTDQGVEYNYNSLDPHLIGMVLRAASKQSISQLLEQLIWQPMGAQFDATFLTDSKGVEELAGGFNANAVDWLRLGVLVAQNGKINGRQVVSQKWFEEIRKLRPDEKYLDKDGSKATAYQGYKFFFRRPYKSSKILLMQGAHGQNLWTDTDSGIAMLALSVTNDYGSYEKLFKRIRSDLA
jgi:CubicO group peptidase (beta-lactamase class C family)